jgi:hypothetical protein
MVLGLNLRSYDTASRTWSLVPPELGGVRFDRHFTSRGERSDDGTAWSEFRVVAAFTVL